MNTQTKNATLWEIARLQIAYDKAYAKWMSCEDDADCDYYAEICYQYGSKMNDLEHEMKRN